MSRSGWIGLPLALLVACAGGSGVAPGDQDAGASEDGGAAADGGPQCVRNTDCASHQRCDSASGSCVSASGGDVGDACEASADCSQGGQASCLVSNLGFPSGYCVSDCRQDECEGTSLCVTGLSANGGASVCVATCSSSADCRAKYQCVPINGGVGVCMPPCQDTSVCGDGQTCDSATGLCRTSCTSSAQCPAWQICTAGRYCEEASTDGGSGGNPGVVTETPLGNVTANGQVSVTATVPSDALSTFFIARTNGPQFYPIVQLSFLREPGGKVVYGGSQDVMKVSPNAGGDTGVLYPNAPPPRTTGNPDNLPGLPYVDGNYTVGFVSTPITSVAVTMVTKTSNGALTSGTIDVNLWFDSSRYTAQSARSSSTFQSALRSVQSIWAAAGIQMGKVNYLDLPDPSREYRNIQGGEVLAISALTGGAPNDGVNWIFVDSIDGSGGGGNTTLGVAAGIPGIPLRGSSQSGVAVSLLSLQSFGGAQRLATTIAHETGHWLGLFHTSEATGTDFDPLPDTPQCPASSYDRDGDEAVSDTECSTMDGRNLMFWLSDSTGRSPHTSISADQRFVLLRNPTLH